MAKISSVIKNNRRAKWAKSQAPRRQQLKALIMNKSTSMEERFEAVLRLASMKRNGAKTRVRNRCELTGRSRGNYQKFKLSRVMLRQLANFGQIPGMTKSSW